METSQLINSLTEELKPVKSLPAPITRFGMWFAITVLTLGVFLYFFGFRPNLMALASTPRFFLESLLTLCSAIVLGFGAFSFSVPGYAKESRVKWTASLFVIGLVLLVSSRLVSRPDEISFWSALTAPVPCAKNILWISLLPILTLFVGLRRAYPLSLAWSGFLAAGAGAGMAMLAVQFICPSEASYHIILHHLIPTLVVSFLGMGALSLFMPHRNNKLQ